MSLHYDGCRVMVVAHQVVVLCMRYLLEHMTEEQILKIDVEGDVIAARRRARAPGNRGAMH